MAPSRACSADRPTRPALHGGGRIRLWRDILWDVLSVLSSGTSVLTAALRSRRGTTFVLLQAVRRGRLTPLVTPSLFLEYEECR